MDLQTITDFVDTVDLILSEVELNREGGRLEVYLDTADVRGAALGMYSFYEFGSFQSKLFDSERALVRALAGRGDLGAFQMLGPHQAELLSLMSEAFGVRHEESVSQYASRFWHDARIFAESASLHDLTDDKLRQLLANQIGNGANFFKAVESIRGDWRWRFKEWRRIQCFEIKTAPDDLVPHLASDVFEKIKKHLNKLRPKRTDNNFADAVALVMLMAKVDDFNNAGVKGSLPCFYAAPHFVGVINTVGLADRLMVTLPNQRRVSVLRGADYFVLRVIFSHSEQLGANAEVLLTPDKLRLIHAEMQEILRSYKTLKSEQRKGVDVPTSHAINALVKEVRDLSFFDNVWLPYRAERDAQDSLKRLQATEYVMSRADVQPALESEVRKLQASLRVNADRFETLRSLWKAIPSVFVRQQRLLRLRIENESDLMRYTGLIRFSFPPYARERIFKSIAALVSGDEQRRRDATGMIVRAYFSFASAQRHTMLDAEHAAGVLWVAKLDQYILKMLGDPRRPHFSLDLIYAASAIRLGRDLEAALRTFESLERQRQTVTVGADRADIALGLAYLYYHWWHRYRDSQQARHLVRNVLGFTSAREVISAAVNRATEAYQALEGSPDEAKLAYVLNQRVYFMSIAMTYSVDLLKPLAEKLRDDYQERDLWQYRYDDTLARYYDFRAARVRDDDGKEEFLALGLERAKRAFKEAPEDVEIQTTLEKLRDELATVRGERPRQ